MHELARCVRFSVNPFTPQTNEISSPFLSKADGEGLSIFFELAVKLTGPVEPATGFVINVTEIDRKVEQYVVPLFSQELREDFQSGKHIGFSRLAELLKSSWQRLADKFGVAELSGLVLALNPFAKIAIDCGDPKMVYLSEKFEFAATHKLWNNEFSDERNLQVFGKCANPSGHGHNYTLEVTIKTPADQGGFSRADFGRVVQDDFMSLVDHKNLNVDVPYFSKVIPTVENIAVFAWDKIVDRLGEALLHCVTVWETDKTFSSYYGPNR